MKSTQQVRKIYYKWRKYMTNKEIMLPVWRVPSKWGKIPQQGRTWKKTKVTTNKVLTIW